MNTRITISALLGTAMMAGAALAPASAEEGAECPAVTAPVVLKRYQPDYPDYAAVKGVGGSAKLRLTVDREGKVSDVEILAEKPKDVFGKPSKRALRRWRYEPHLVDGEPTCFTVTQTMTFSVEVD